MAYPVEMAQSNGTAAITSIAMNMPAHQADDILVAHIVVDSGTATIAGSSWAALPSAPANPITSGIVSYLLYVKAAGSSETLTLTTGDAYTCGIYCFRDVDPTTPFDGVTPKHAAVAGATTTPASESVTTGTADALVVFHVAQDGVTPMVLSDPGVMWFDGFDSTGTTATTSAHEACAWYVQRSTGASPVANWASSVSAVYVRATYALRNKSGGRIPAYIDDVSSPATRITQGHHTATQNNIAYAGALTTSSAINGKTVTLSAVTLGADFGVNPYANAVGRTAAITAATALQGFELTLTGGRNLSTGLVMGSLIALSPKSGTFGLGSIAQGGYVVRIGSGASNWEAYQVAAKDSIPTTEQRYVFAIQAGDTTTDYGTPGTATNTAAITYMQFLMNCPAFAANVYLSELHQVFTQIIAGGDANFPVDTAGMADVGKSFRLPVIQKVGAAGLLSYARIQIGGGDAVNFQIDAGALQFPRIYSTTAKEIAYHAASNFIGISYAGKSGDVIKHTNSVVTSPSPYYWEINSAATSAATWDFTGLVIVGANVTLRNVMTFDSMGFSSCPTLNFTGCTVTNATISKIPTTNDTLTTSSTTVIQNSNINTTLLTPGNRWASVATADLDMFSDCNFTGSATSGHAIRLSSTGSVTISGNTFTSYGPAARSFNTGSGVNGSTEVVTLDADHGYSNGNPVYYQDQGGAVTMGLTDGTLYYVRSIASNQLAFYTSSANAIADTSRVNLTSSGSETHYIYSAAAAIYNNSGGAVTINVTGGGGVPSYRNSDGSSTTVVLSVNVSLTVVNDAGTAVEGVQVYLQKSASGKSWNYTADTANNAGDADFVVNETVDADIPSSGWIHVQDVSTTTQQNYRYSSWSGKTFTFPTEVTGSTTSGGTSTTLNSTGIGALNIQEGDTIRNTTDGSWAIVDELSTNSATTSTLQGGSDNTWQNGDSFSVHRLAVTYEDGVDMVDIPIFNGQTNASGQISTTYNYSAFNTNLPIVIRVRSNTGATKYVPYNTSGTITSSGFSGTVVLTQDTVAT